MDNVQVELASLCEFYKNVYELPPDEKPEDDVIQDDTALTKHLEDLNRKRAEKLLKHG